MHHSSKGQQTLPEGVDRQQGTQRKKTPNPHVRSRAGEVDEARRANNRAKSKIRARVEHVFGAVKRLWRFNKVRYKKSVENIPRPDKVTH